jgi:hypothetical protein
MIQRQERLERIRRVEREYLAGADALRLLEQQLGADPSWRISEGWTRKDAQNLARNLEATFLIRVFAEFESGLRDFWEKSLGRATHPSVKDLLDSIAARRDIPQDWLDDVHEVRNFRNSFVHERKGDEISVSLSEARGRLCRFFSWLPGDW